MKQIKKLLLAGIIMLTAATASMGNTAPIANAGIDQTVSVGSQVSLDGGASYDADRDRLTYGWSFTIQPPGSTAILSKTTAKRTRFTADMAGTYELELVVDDGTEESADSVVITATGESAENTPPVAYAGADQTIATSETATLDGSGSSDAERDPLTYRWSFTSQPTGSTPILSKPTAKRTKFTTDTDGSYVIQLIVNDGTFDSNPDSATIHVGGDITAPVIILDGDNPMEVIQYDIFTDPGATATDDRGVSVDVTSEGSVDTSIVGEYIITYTASDSAGNTATETRTVNVVAGNIPPVSFLLKTGQTQSYNVDGDIVIDGSIKDDGYYKAGIARSYTRDSDNKIVIDNVTGLEWQDNENVEIAFSGASNYCDTLSLGEYDDWRLPTVQELLTLMDDGTYNPTLTEYIFQTYVSYAYWSSTVYLGVSGEVWVPYFNYGGLTGDGTGNYHIKHNVRCVRGKQLEVSNFSRSSDNIVSDSTTGLQWQDDVGASGAERTWTSAIGYCEQLKLGDYEDWRLPNRKELLSIVDFSRHDPAIDISVFSNYSYGGYWSSTSYAYQTIYAQLVGFENGSSTYYDKSNSLYVRCVRSNPPPCPDGEYPIQGTEQCE